MDFRELIAGKVPMRPDPAGKDNELVAGVLLVAAGMVVPAGWRDRRSRIRLGRPSPDGR